MLKLGSLSVGRSGARMLPRVAVAYSDDVSETEIRDARKAGVDIAEIRIDLFRSMDPRYVLKKVAIFRSLPTVATIRIAKEGGGWKGSEKDRLALFEKVLPHVDAVDVELSSLEQTGKFVAKAKKAGKVAVISHHNFKETPKAEFLENIVKESHAAGADIIKIAAKVLTSSDVRTLASVLATSNHNLLIIGMGGEGLITRLMFPALGSVMTFASVGRYQTAPGQIPYPDMMERLRQLYPAYNEEKIIKLKILECV
jgi:3-dehydroquinate dehydratase-1